MSEEIKNEINWLSNTSDGWNHGQRVNLSSETLKTEKDCQLEYLRTQVRILDEKLEGEIQDRKDRKDFAYCQTQRDREISFDDILREVGDTEEYVQYISGKMRLENSFC